jgi:hypothetical protein
MSLSTRSNLRLAIQLARLLLPRPEKTISWRAGSTATYAAKSVSAPLS